LRALEKIARGRRVTSECKLSRDEIASVDEMKGGKCPRGCSTKNQLAAAAAAVCEMMALFVNGTAIHSAARISPGSYHPRLKLYILTSTTRTFATIRANLLFHA
jgi:hypothetical protein